MTLFLTSIPTGDLDGKYIPSTGLDTRNGFLTQLKKVWKADSRCLIITASPNRIAANEEMLAFFHQAVDTAGLSCSVFDLWDSRMIAQADILPLSYDVIFLGGGHVPTQQAFFSQIHLREKLQNFDGIVIGISAGSMNCADSVYAMPEEPGEAIDPDYPRFLPGLGLTATNILPHYQILKDNTLDGKKLFAEIALPDSIGRQFVVLPDGSYIVEKDGEQTIYGTYDRISNGQWNITEA